MGIVSYFALSTKRGLMRLTLETALRLLEQEVRFKGTGIYEEFRRRR